MPAPILYGAKIRLRHRDSGALLKSVRKFYGHPAGSWQQIVGADATEGDDVIWLVKGPNGTPANYQLGLPVKNGDTIRLEHVATQKNLHSHSAKSPITGQQEVTAFQEPRKPIGEGDGNDNWRVVLDQGEEWAYGAIVKLEFGNTGTFLHSNSGISHRMLTAGLQEVTGVSPAVATSLWQAEPVGAQQAPEKQGVRVFISHSTKDKTLAAALVALLRSALGLSKAAIRCSSVAGHKFPLGSAINPTIKQEVEKADVFVALVTPSSLVSPYVLFEMGARWGRNLFFASLIARGADREFLKTPVAELLALNGADEDDLHEFLKPLASRLGLQAAPPEDYSAALKKVAWLSRKPKKRRARR